MKRLVENFEGYLSLNESNRIESEFPSKWKELQDLGFYEDTPPRIKANGNILLKNDALNYYPEGILLQPTSGYVRDKGATSGFLKRGLNLEQMVDYVIQRYKKLSLEAFDASSLGISTDILMKLKKITKSKVSKNAETGRFDFAGSIFLTPGSMDFLVDNGIKIGSIKGNFEYNGDFRHRRSPNLEFFPLEVGKDYKLSYFPLRSLKVRGINIPKIVKGDLVLRNLELNSLEGCPDIVKGSFNCSHNNLRSLVGGPKVVRGRYDCERNPLVYLEGAPKTLGGKFNFHSIEINSGQWGVPKFLEIFKNAETEEKKQLILPLIGPEVLQKEIGREPEKMAILCKPFLDKEWFKDFGLKWPAHLQSEIDLLGDLERIGL